jgi:NADPH:quinone reductase-like Zn-dependent oxidoreductase
LIPGIDAAGTVVGLGANVSTVSAGTRVLLNPAVTCDACEYCLAGNHGTCRRRKAIGQLLNGSYAEYITIPASNVHAIRDDMTFEEAAAIPSAFFTAWQLLILRARVVPSETVLVMAAASGVGSAALQVAKLSGCKVIAAAGSDRKLELIGEWGADGLINYSKEKLPDRVLEMTDGRGVHAIVDTVGASAWEGYMKCIRAGGRIVTCSAIAGSKPSVDIFDLIRNQVSILGSGPQGSKSEAAKVVRLVNEGRLRGVVDRVLPLKDAALAQAAMENRDVVGKIVLQP